MFAIIEHLKESYGGPAEELEKSLLKVRSQVDRKMQIVDFASSRKPAAPLADRSNRPSTAPAAAAKPAAPAQVEAFAPPASAAPAAPAAPAAAEAEAANIQGPQRTPPRLPVAPRALLADAAALELVAAFAAGRDHLSMSGSEMHGLVHWLKSKGKSEVEDLLMVYKTLGEKKFQLCQHIRMVQVPAFGWCHSLPPKPPGPALQTREERPSRSDHWQQRMVPLSARLKAAHLAGPSRHPGPRRTGRDRQPLLGAPRPNDAQGAGLAGHTRPRRHCRWQRGAAAAGGRARCGPRHTAARVRGGVV